MICGTCGIEGHDSQGKKELCLVAVVARCKRHEARLADFEDALDSMVRQYAYRGVKNNVPVLFTGCLSTLEEAFRVLGWNNAHPVPEDKCNVDGCPDHATCGKPAKDGSKYLRVCGDHYRDSSL